jgi:hypothetical protein
VILLGVVDDQGVLQETHIDLGPHGEFSEI